MITLKLLDKLYKKWKDEYIEQHKNEWETETLEVNREEWERKAIEKFMNECSEEVKNARDAIIFMLRETQTSLPAACFALDLVKQELVRAELEEFLGHVKLNKDVLPLAINK